MTGLDTISTSSSMMIGLIALPSVSSLTNLDGSNPALRQVAWRAKQARCGAIDEYEDAVETEEIDDERDNLELSDTIDSGLDPVEPMLMIDGRLVAVYLGSKLGMPAGFESKMHRFMLVF